MFGFLFYILYDFWVDEKPEPVRQDSHKRESYSLIIVAPGQYEIEICCSVLLLLCFFFHFHLVSQYHNEVPTTWIANKVLLQPRFLSIKLLNEESIQCKECFSVHFRVRGKNAKIHFYTDETNSYLFIRVCEIT